MNREGITWISPGHSWLCWAFDQLTQHWGNPQQILLSPPCSVIPWSTSTDPPGLLQSASGPGHNQNQFLSRELLCKTRLGLGTNPKQGNLPSKPKNLWVFTPTQTQGVNPWDRQWLLQSKGRSSVSLFLGSVFKFLPQKPGWIQLPDTTSEEKYPWSTFADCVVWHNLPSCRR